MSKYLITIDIKMNFSLKNFKNKLLFVPLGGAGEIGANLNLYHLEEKWIIVDCGIGFSDQSLPGVDIIVPDVSFIKEIKNNLLALFITHAHEDHIGAIPYLWEELNCPIYATTFAKNVLKKKNLPFKDQMQIHDLAALKKVDLGPFSVEALNMNHSIPEMQALFIRTKLGNILHTGDWKFESKPIIGTELDKKKLSQFQSEGVLALVSDSTNVFEENQDKSELMLKKNLSNIIKKASGLILITTFASNIARLESIISIASQCKKKVALAGLSMKNMFESAQQSGYLSNADSVMISERDIGLFPRNQIIVIATGCQGEPNAALNRIIKNNFPYLKLTKSDKVIFSSKIIPGNDKKIFKLLNLLAKNDIEFITEKMDLVHVSGHPSSKELKDLYNLVKPQIAIPVHGEPVHLKQHAKLAKSFGAQEIVTAYNGKVVLIEKNCSQVLGEVKVGYLAVDGNYLIPSTSNLFKDRTLISKEGIIILSVLMNQLYDSHIILNTPGILDEIHDIDLIQYIKSKILEQLTQLQNLDTKSMKLHLRKIIAKIIKKEVNKFPLIIVNIT